MDRIAQEAHARQGFLEYFLRHGDATEAAIRYKTGRKTLYKWLKRYDGTWQNLDILPLPAQSLLKNAPFTV